MTLRGVSLLAEDLYEQLSVVFGQGGGTYSIRANDEHGLPTPISRVLGTDRTGLLYVGKADTFTSRVVHLKKCVHPDYVVTNHPSGSS